MCFYHPLSSSADLPAPRTVLLPLLTLRSCWVDLTTAMQYSPVSLYSVHKTQQWDWLLGSEPRTSWPCQHCSAWSTLDACTIIVSHTSSVYYASCPLLQSSVVLTWQRVSLPQPSSTVVHDFGLPAASATSNRWHGWDLVNVAHSLGRRLGTVFRLLFKNPPTVNVLNVTTKLFFFSDVLSRVSCFT